VLKSMSITRRIISGVLLAELISAVIISLTSVAFERHIHFQAFDVMLHGRAEALLGAVADANDVADDVMLDTHSVTIPRGDLFEVQENNGRVLGRSEKWPAAITAGDVQAGSKNGIYRTSVNHHDYRFVQLNAVRTVDPGEHGGTPHNITVLYGSPTTHVRHEIYEAVRFYSILSLSLLIATAGLTAWFLRNALFPLHQLASEAGGISASQWSFNPPETARSTRELAPLTRAIEAALARLELSFAQQRRFTSDAAHELKTDVAIIKSSLQLLTMRDRSADDYRNGLEVCLEDCTRLESTVQQMLTLARVEYESDFRIPLATESIDMADYVDDAVSQFSSLAQLKDIAINVAKTGTAQVCLDVNDGALLCSNLLHNALQHSPSGSTISIRLTDADGWITFSIVDEGEGIPENVLPHVFEPFFRADSSRDRKSGGTGLGLAICKAICARAGGSIVIDSVVNKETQVSVKLPSYIEVKV
jgi:signal transduction histidine kinase